MQRIALMQIEAAFEILNVGLVVVPSFAVSPGGKWQPLKERVLIEVSDGKQIEAEALIYLHIHDPQAGAGQRWQIAVSFKALTQADVPVGSRILAGQDLVLRLRPGATP